MGIAPGTGGGARPCRGGPAPIVLLHGGPGGTHDYLEPLLDLGDGGRPVVLYDQIGNGRSDHLRDAPAEFWTVELFKRELTCLLEDLGFADRYPCSASRGAGCWRSSTRSTGPRASPGWSWRTRRRACRSGPRRPTACAPACRPTSRRC